MLSGDRPVVLRRHLGLTVVPGEGAFLLCEHGSAVVDDPVAARVLSLVDGRGVDRLVEDLADEFDTDLVRTAVDRLADAGLITTADPGGDTRSAAYWESAGLTAADAEDDAARPVALHVFGAVDRQVAENAMRTAGIRLTSGDDAALDVALTDDYLDPALTGLHADMRSAARTWLLAKPVGVRLMVGPVLGPAESCYTCLGSRLRGHRPAEEYLSRRLSVGPSHAPPWISPPMADVAATRVLGMSMVSTAVLNRLAGNAAGGPVLTVLDTLTCRATTSPAPRRPQCPDCGSPDLVTAHMSAPVRPASRMASAHTDGGRRARTPEQMLSDYAHLVDPLTGVVASLDPIAPALPFLDAYSAGPNRAMPVRTLRDLRGGLRVQSCGKGTSDAQARASALGEALERASGVHSGDEPRIRARLVDLGERGIHPNACQLFSDRQLARRTDSDGSAAPYAWVPAPFDPQREIEWTPVWSFSTGRHRYLPTAQLFYGYPQAGPVSCWADSNGSAAGTTVEDALLQGCYELIERDAVAIWWYNRLVRSAVDLDKPSDPWIERLRTAYAAIGREVWALDISSDIDVPVVVALSRRIDTPAEDIIFGFGAHPDGQIALRRALSELNQFLPAVANVCRDGSGYASGDPTQLRWWRTAVVADNPFLRPDPDLPVTRFSDPAVDAGADLLDEWGRCRSELERRGLEVLAIDLTRPDIGLPVVKVVVPGMRHFWARYAPGRLYDVPVQLGALTRAREEHQLNTTPVFV